MLITLKQLDSLSYVVIDDLYEPDELLQIEDELRRLTTHFEIPEHTGVATSDEGKPLKNSMGVNIDDLYNGHRDESVVLRLNRKLFCDPITEEASKLNQYFRNINRCNRDGTLINFYASGEGYKPHVDYSMLTAVTYFSLGKIEGGDFVFSDFNEVVPFRPNRTVIFPGCVLHEAKPTVAEEGSYRVSMAQFLNYR